MFDYNILDTIIPADRKSLKRPLGIHSLKMLLVPAKDHSEVQALRWPRLSMVPHSLDTSPSDKHRFTVMLGKQEAEYVRPQPDLATPF